MKPKTRGNALVLGTRGVRGRKVAEDIVYSKGEDCLGQVDIILFHPEGEDILLRTNVLRGLNYQVYDPVKDAGFNIPALVQAGFRYLKQYKRLHIKGLSLFGSLQMIIRRIRAQLIAGQLRKREPKAVLTFVDNSNLFHMVCEVCTEIPFLAIQNGVRNAWDASEASYSEYCIDEYYCFGPYVQNLFEKHGHTKTNKYITCGSLIGGYFFGSQHPSNDQTIPDYDVCLISQYGKYMESMEGVPAAWKNLRDAQIIMTEFVARYASENQIKVCVALRPENPSERKFYEGIFKGNCVFQEGNRLTFSSYKAVAAAKLSVAIDSTLASEAFGAGLKVLYVNPLGEEWLKPTSSVGSWYLSGPSYEEFSARMTSLLEMSMEDYLTEAREEMRHVMSYDFTRPAHMKIRDRLLEIVGGEKQPVAFVE